MSVGEVWYLIVAGQKDGPYGKSDILNMFDNGEINENTLAYAKGLADWTPLKNISDFGEQLKADESWLPSVPAVDYATTQLAHEIDFKIYGEEMQLVEVELDPNETVVAEAGALMYMDKSIKMETIFGDGSQKSDESGIMGKLFTAGKRVVTGEGLFMTAYTHEGTDKAKVAFAAPYPGKIMPVDLRRYDGKIVCQKDAFLCAAKGVSVGVEFNKKIGVGLFGGEGFIMQKLEGDGLGFIHAGGTVIKKDLKAGETLKIDTGCLVALTKDVQYEVEFVSGVKSALFGGEGLFFTTLTGPGSVWLQSIPFARFAARVHKNAVGKEKKGEGSVLGGLGNLIDGK